MLITHAYNVMIMRWMLYVDLLSHMLKLGLETQTIILNKWLLIIRGICFSQINIFLPSSSYYQSGCQDSRLADYKALDGPINKPEASCCYGWRPLKNSTFTSLLWPLLPRLASHEQFEWINTLYLHLPLEGSGNNQNRESISINRSVYKFLF